MRYLVTGAAGFIASNVASQLLDQGHEVVGLDDLNAYYDPRLKEWRLARLRARKGFAFLKADVADRAAVERAFADGPFDAVFNLAARAGVRASLEDPWIYQRTNAEGMINVLEACRRRDVRKVVLASTSSLYGIHNPRPFSEDADTSRPLSPYAASKKAAEAQAAAYAHVYGMDTPVLRYFTVFGPAGRPDMSVYRFVRWVVEGEKVVIYGDGLQERDFTYVDDIARGTIAALDVRGFDVVNLGSDRPVPLIDVLRRVEARVGKKAHVEHHPAHVADVRATWANIDKARKVLGWEPKVSWQEGVDRSVDWYLENRTWASTLATTEG